MHRMILISASLLLTIAAGTWADEAVPSAPQAKWWRGNLHTHSLWSDGDDFPEMIAEWYRTHGYHFLALSDHNVLSQGKRFMKLAAIESRGGDQVLPKYLARFGQDWVETKGTVGSDDYAIRLKPLDEFRSLIDERGKFIMIQAEEISDRSEGGPVHMNATNLHEQIEPSGGATVRETMANNLRMAEQQAIKLGREMIVHLNHPNFGYAVTAEDIAAVIQERFFEVHNGHPVVGQLGDASHPSIERMWDIANTIRIGELNAAPIFGVATDDSHNYHGKPNGATTGRGWVMVRAKFLTPEHLIRAMKAGDFYASSGVYLNHARYDASQQTLTVSIQPRVAGETFTTHFIGTRRNYDATSEPRQVASEDKNAAKRITRKYSSDVGATLSTVRGRTAIYKFTGDELYVRAMIVSSAEVDDPSWPDQRKQAWTQPIQPQ